MKKRDFLKLVQEAGILTNLSEVSLPSFSQRRLVAGVQGEAVVEGKSVSLVVSVSYQFPRCHPVFFLVKHESYQVLPHVEQDGFICYTRRDDIVLDIDNPKGIIQDCFEMAMTTLQDSFSGRNRDDFYNEYEAYWRQLKNNNHLFSNIDIDDKVSTIRYAKFRNKDALFAFTDDKVRCQTFGKLFDSEKELPVTHTGIFIPLQAGSEIFIPSENTLLDSNYLQALIEGNLSSENEKRLKLLLMQTKQEDLLIFCLPQPNGYYSLFGVRLKNISFKQHPLLSAATPVTIEPLVVSRVDPEYLLVRGGTGKSYMSKRILVNLVLHIVPLYRPFSILLF